MKRITDKLVSFLSALAVTVAVLPFGTMLNAAAAEIGVSAAEDTSYYSYYNKYRAEVKPKTEVNADFGGNTTVDGKTAFKYGKENNTADFSVEVPENGIYSLKICYRTFEEDSSTIRISVKADGKAPFDEAERLELDRCYSDGEIGTDKYGNDVRPVSAQKCRWIENYVYDSSGLYVEPYIVYFTAGRHIITLKTENIIAVSSLKLANEQSAVSYEEYISNYANAESGKMLRLEAEKIYEKNDTGVYPTYDHADAATLPADPVVIKLNTVGQSGWSREGSYISWKPDIEKAGLYSLSFRANQSYNESGASCRKLLVNGEIPFSEAENIEFDYSAKWYIKTLGDKTPYYVYLKPGDILTLQCVSKSTSEIARQINECLTQMSNIYREMIVVTGTSPDSYRDYNLDVKIPTLTDDLKKAVSELNKAVKLSINRSGKNSNAVSTLKQALETLENMINKPYEMQNGISSLSDNIESIGSLVMTVGEQPLELDCIYLTAKNDASPKGGIGFFGKALYGIKRFVASFVSNYGSLEKSTDKLTVWISTGRDQLQILQRMIEQDYENSSDTKTSLSLVDTGATLLQATLAGKGPDVALNIGSEYTMNLAAREAIVELGKYGVNELNGNFAESAWTPLLYKNGVYAIPETQSFEVMFYRTDIFSQLGLQVPETWDDFYNVLEVLQRNNLEIGIQEIGGNAGVSQGISAFARFLLQNGGTYYTDDYKKTAFDSDEAYDAFNKWVELYSKYGLDRSFDFFNRFRTGVMPLAIQGYGAYNQLYSAAPEIRGLWKMAPVPGTKQADGSINRSENAGVTGCVMLKSAVKKKLDNAAYSFMKWWTSADTQLRYANELESAMGISARYAPANLETLAKIGWSDEELSVLTSQLKETINFWEIPGNYVLSRSLTSAFRKALTVTEMPERQLEIYNKDINDELARKAKEFKLY